MREFSIADVLKLSGRTVEENISRQPSHLAGRFSGMRPFRTTSIPEQLAEHLLREVVEGRLSGVMPGVLRLERQTGVNRKTVEAALRLLEKEGLLAAQGAGKRRKILVAEGAEKQSLRVGLLLSDPSDMQMESIIELRHLLTETGHNVIRAPIWLSERGVNLGRIAGMVERNPADAWIVTAGSREVLEWFAAGKTPAFALFGMMRGMPIAGAKSDKIPAYQAATRRLIQLGHHRIVLLARTRRRLPEPGAVERAFLAELAAHGIDPGAYHLPHWEDSVEGLFARLETLFRITPPTALIIQESGLFVAALHFLARKGIRVPGDVSMICTDDSPDFAWCQPQVSHIRWDSGPVVRRIVHWANNVRRGRKDLRQTLTPAEFVVGGTIGPAKG